MLLNDINEDHNYSIIKVITGISRHTCQCQ